MESFFFYMKLDESRRGGMLVDALMRETEEGIKREAHCGDGGVEGSGGRGVCGIITGKKEEQSFFLESICESG